MDVKKISNELRKKYELASKRRTELIEMLYFKIINQRDFDKELNELVELLKGQSFDFVDKHIPEAYVEGVEFANKQALKTGLIEKTTIGYTIATSLKEFEKNADKTMRERQSLAIKEHKQTFDNSLEMARKQANRQKIEVLNKQKEIDLIKRNALLERQRNKALKISERTAKETLKKGLTTRELIDKTDEEFRKKIKSDSSDIMFRDRGGKRWSFPRYAEMLSVQALTEASRSASVDEYLSLGFDIAEVKTSGNPCPNCASWGGRLISMSGKNPNFPSYQEAKAQGQHFLNVHCQCSLLLTSKAIKEY